MQYRQADVAFEIEKQKAEAQLKAQLMQQEFNYRLTATRNDADTTFSKERLIKKKQKVTG